MAGFVNNVLFNPTLGGTTDWVVDTAVAGFNTPAGAGAVDGRLYKYKAESADFSQWEVGEGTYSSGTGTLTRTTVLLNSLGTTAKVNFSTVPQVGVVTLAQDLLGIDQANSFSANQKAQGRANLDVLKKNYIINGAMMVSQENGATAGTISGYYPVDQFHVNFTHAGAVSIAQVASATPAGSPNRLRVTVTTADASVAAGDFISVFQPIEGHQVADLLMGTASAKTIVIQFGVKAPAGTYSVVLKNSAVNRSYVAEYIIAGGEANTDVLKSVSFALDTSGTWLKNTGVGCYVVFGLMVGTTFQQAAGSWGTVNAIGSPSQFNFMGTIGNVFELFDVGLYEGSAAPAFQVPDFTTELVRCQRYWEKSWSYDILLINSGGLAGNEGYFLTGIAGNAHQSGFFSKFKVPKRATPTCVIYSPNSGVAGNVFDAVSGADVAGTIDQAGTNSVRTFATGAASATVALYWGWTANARM